MTARASTMTVWVYSAAVRGPLSGHRHPGHSQRPAKKIRLFCVGRESARPHDWHADGRGVRSRHLEHMGRPVEW